MREDKTWEMLFVQRGIQASTGVDGKASHPCAYITYTIPNQSTINKPINLFTSLHCFHCYHIVCFDSLSPLHLLTSSLLTMLLQHMLRVTRQSTLRLIRRLLRPLLRSSTLLVDVVGRLTRLGVGLVLWVRGLAALGGVSLLLGGHSCGVG